MPCEEFSEDGKITIEMDMGEMRQPFNEIRQSLPTSENSSDEEMAVIMRSRVGQTLEPPFSRAGPMVQTTIRYSKI